MFDDVSLLVFLINSWPTYGLLESVACFRILSGVSYTAGDAVYSEVLCSVISAVSDFIVAKGVKISTDQFFPPKK